MKLVDDTGRSRGQISLWLCARGILPTASCEAMYMISVGVGLVRYTHDVAWVMIGNLLDAFISFSERFERMLVTPGKRRRVPSTKAL